MSHTVELTDRSEPAVPLAWDPAERRAGAARGGSWESDPSAAVPQRRASTGLLVYWPATVPLPRGPYARRASVRPPELWCVDRASTVPRGSDVFLMMTGHTPGLVGRGLVSRSPFLAARMDRIGTVSLHVAVEWLELLSAAARIPVESLEGAVPDWDWLPGEPSSVIFPAELVERVDLLWTHWHHRPQHRHRVAEWVRPAQPRDPGAPSASGGRDRHRRMFLAGQHLRTAVRHGG